MTDLSSPKRKTRIIRRGSFQSVCVFLCAIPRNVSVFVKNNNEEIDVSRIYVPKSLLAPGGGIEEPIALRRTSTASRGLRTQIERFTTEALATTARPSLLIAQGSISFVFLSFEAGENLHIRTGLRCQTFPFLPPTHLAPPSGSCVISPSRSYIEKLDINATSPPPPPNT